jgi:Protein of unknown function (DUF3602)
MIKAQPFGILMGISCVALQTATSGRGGAGNLYSHVLEDGVFERVIAHEDVLIRQHREMQISRPARWTGRGGVGNIKRSEDDPDQEHCE